jgi:hypothetical protein
VDGLVGTGDFGINKLRKEFVHRFRACKKKKIEPVCGNQSFPALELYLFKTVSLKTNNSIENQNLNHARHRH